MSEIRGTWEYVPYGGMVLTAGDKAGIWQEGYDFGVNDERMSQEATGGEIAPGRGNPYAASALFPATEPAEEETKADPFKALHDVITFSSMDFGSASDVAWMYGIVVGWDNDDPDEGEHPHAAMWSIAQRFNWPHRKVEELRNLRAEWVRRTSSPVAPAPIPTEWDRIEDVPAGVTRVEDCEGDTWVIDNGKWYPHCLNPSSPDRFAPFVAAEKEEA
jgi:hypothetical protein